MNMSTSMTYDRHVTTFDPFSFCIEGVGFTLLSIMLVTGSYTAIRGLMMELAIGDSPTDCG